MHKAEVQLLLDIACDEFSAIKPLTVTKPGLIYGFASRAAPDVPRPDAYEHYMPLGVGKTPDDALDAFAEDMRGIVALHGIDNLRWRRQPKLDLLHNFETDQRIWKVRARVCAALTPEAAAQFPA